MLGAVSEPLSCAADFLAVVEQAKARRATHATGANEVSSRSHAVIRLTVGSGTDSPPRAAGGVGGGGARPAVLTLVDCAGTERKEDSATHSAERRKEGAEINTSLHALKECLRHWLMKQTEGNKVHIPFRLSALTRVLAESFVREDTMVAVVGTLSPASADAEHSLATMRTVCSLAGEDARVTEVKEEVKPPPPATPRRQAPSKWSAARVREWVGEVQGGALAGLVPLLPAGLDGRALSRLSARQMGAMWKCPQKEDLCAMLFTELRSEMKKVGGRSAATLARLQPRLLEAATPCVRGCSPAYQRLQPRVLCGQVDQLEQQQRRLLREAEQKKYGGRAGDARGVPVA